MTARKYPDDPGPGARLAYFTILSAFALCAAGVCALAAFGLVTAIGKLFSWVRL